MQILSYNPGHDGAVAVLRENRLILSIEAEKDSNYRYSPVSSQLIFDALAELTDAPDVIAVGGWWPRDHHEFTSGNGMRSSYRGVHADEIVVGRGRFIGNEVVSFSSSHERSHILCALGMSSLPKGTPCYALVWEGAIGAFYEIDANATIQRIGDVLSEPGNRYSLLYGLADPTFPKTGTHPRFSDAGKLMALASYSKRSIPTVDERKLLRFLLDGPYQDLSAYSEIQTAPHFNVGLDDSTFRDFAGILSDAIFEIFFNYARANLTAGLPLLIAGGCGLNCDWNSKWLATGLFSEVFVPPVANDSGSAIGTAIDAQLYLTGNAKIDWDVYAGLDFVMTGPIDQTRYDVRGVSAEDVANMLTNDLILGWVNARYEIGPRALGNRSILAAPFKNSTRERLNNIKQREQFRPIAPVCLQEDAEELFGCRDASPYMLYTYTATAEALAAVTHVNGSARIQTVTSMTNGRLHDLLLAFKRQTGYGVLCNTSLNFSGRGCINNLRDLDRFAVDQGLDGFVINGTGYLLKSSARYRDCQNHEQSRGE